MLRDAVAAAAVAASASVYRKKIFDIDADTAAVTGAAVEASGSS